MAGEEATQAQTPFYYLFSGEEFARRAKQMETMRDFGTSVASSFFPEVAKVWRGESDRTPDAKDWRFQHPAWKDNPFFKGMVQTYLAWSDAVTKAAEAMETDDWRDSERMRLLASMMTSTFSPTNNIWTNPAALQRAIETGGQSLARGYEQFRKDREERRSIPVQVDASGFEVGKNLAVTPGAVVFRTDLFELIQYAPTTPTVSERPVLIVPPPIGKYYFLDLAKGRSLVEHAVGQGLQVFMISWRNPGAAQREWHLDTYAGGIIRATDAVRDIAGSETLNVLGFCAGGIVLSTALSYLAAMDDKRVNAASFGVMLLDFEEEASIGAFSPATVLDTAKSRSTELGVLPADDLASVFAWLRPNDLVWNYWVNNYLMGEAPPANDIMAWNSDGTNLPAALHQDFLQFFGTNAMAKAGGVTVLNRPVDLSKVTCDTYFMGAVNDHLTPWKACFRSAQLFGGHRTFVLSNAGHIAGLVNPPGNPKAKHFTGRAPDGDPDAWLNDADSNKGTWWSHWSDWMVARAGEQRPAPDGYGNQNYAPLESAPGTYVHVKASEA